MARRRGVTDLEQIDTGGGTTPGEMEILEVGEPRELAIPEPAGGLDVPEDEGIDVIYPTEEAAREEIWRARREGRARPRAYVPRGRLPALPNDFGGVTGLPVAEEFPPAREEPIQGFRGILDRLRREAERATPMAGPMDVAIGTYPPLPPTRFQRLMERRKRGLEGLARAREAGLKQREAFKQQAAQEFYATGFAPSLLGRQRAYRRFLELQREAAFGLRAASIRGGRVPLSKALSEEAGSFKKIALARERQAWAQTRLARLALERQALAGLDPFQLMPVPGPRGTLRFQYRGSQWPYYPQRPTTPAMGVAMNIWGGGGPQGFGPQPSYYRPTSPSMSVAMGFFGGLGGQPVQPEYGPPPAPLPQAYGRATPQQHFDDAPPPGFNPDLHEYVKGYWRTKRPDKRRGAYAQRGFTLGE
ncbi:MAG: hypothetical protein QXQ87_09225 [Halobacteria archaeon]